MFHSQNVRAFLTRARAIEHTCKFETSRALRRLLAEVVDSERFVTLSLANDEGYSTRELAALEAAAGQIERQARVSLGHCAGALLVPMVHRDDAAGVVQLRYALQVPTPDASLSQLQLTLRALRALAEKFEAFALNPAAYAGFADYRYRGCPCSIAQDDRLWMVGGYDKRTGGSGVLEWCANAGDALRLFTQMQRFPDRFFDLTAGRFRDAFPRIVA